MRLIVRMTAFAATVGAALTAAPATSSAAFDQATCDAVRAAANNEALAVRLGDDPDPAIRDCLVRIALLRLGRMGEADYGDDARARGAYRIDAARYAAGEGDFPPAYLEALAAALRQNPSVMRDQVFARAFVQRQMAEGGGDGDEAGNGDGPGDAAIAGAFQVVANGAAADRAASTITHPAATDPAATDPSATDPAAGSTAAGPPGNEGASGKGDRLPAAPVGSIAGLAVSTAAPAASAAPAGAGGGERGAARALAAAQPVPPELARNFAEPAMFPEGARVRLAPAALPQPHPLSREVRAFRAAAAERARREAAPGCADPAADADPDVRRNLAPIEAAGLCLTRHALTEGGVKWRFVSLAHPTHPQGPVWYLPHDNEREAFDAAVYAVARYGGRMVAVAGDEGRNYRGIDPNRYFALTAADARPCAISTATPTYTAFVMDLFVGRPHIFSTHNNTNGGGVSANVWTDKTKGYPITKGRFGDPDNLIYIAGDRPIADDAEATRVRQTLNAAGLGVVHEHVTAANNDCSFSNHVVLHDGRPYFNLEAEHGSRVQNEMMDALLGALGYTALADG